MIRTLIGGLLLLSGAAGHAEAAADAAWAKFSAKLKAAKSITGKAQVRSTFYKSSVDYTFAFLRPNYGRVVRVGSRAGSYCDGNTVWLMFQDGQYRKLPASKPMRSIHMAANGFDPFFDTPTGVFKQGRVEATTFEGRKCLAIERVWSGAPPGVSPLDYFIYVDGETGLPAGFARADQKFVIVYRDIILNAPLKPKDFAFTPPTTAKKMQADPQQAIPPPKLLRPGTRAPQIARKTMSGARWSLAREVAANRATVVNFWFYG